MDSGQALSLLMVAVTCMLLLGGFPVAFTLSGSALIFAACGLLTGAFDAAFLGAIPQRIYGVMTNEVLIAIPLFIFMGVMLERSKVADDLLESMGRLFGRMRGGLGMSIILVGALLAASTGIVGATVMTMGLLSLPTMLRWSYDPALASGLIAASGTLGQIVPPSIILVLLGDVISAAFQRVQLEQQIFSPEVVSVTDLFAGAMLPGLLLVALFIAFQGVVAWLVPAAAPAMPQHGSGRQAERPRLPELLKVTFPPVILILAVLGSILAGIATPTESAAVGAVGTLLLAGLRTNGRSAGAIGAGAIAVLLILFLTSVMDLRITRSAVSPLEMVSIAAVILGCGVFIWGFAVSIAHVHRRGILHDAVRSTGKMTSMIFVIIIAAAVFSVVFRGLGGDELVEGFLTALPGGVFAAMLVVMLIVFLLGFFLDAIEIIYVVVPIVAPALLLFDVDPVWLGIMLALNLQTSYLTPPFGLALFFLRGVAPASVRTIDIYRGVVPFILLQLAGLAIVGAVPGLATWLPKALFGN